MNPLKIMLELTLFFALLATAMFLCYKEITSLLKAIFPLATKLKPEEVLEEFRRNSLWRFLIILFLVFTGGIISSLTVLILDYNRSFHILVQFIITGLLTFFIRTGIEVYRWRHKKRQPAAPKSKR